MQVSHKNLIDVYFLFYFSFSFWNSHIYMYVYIYNLHIWIRFWSGIEYLPCYCCMKNQVTILSFSFVEELFHVFAFL